LPILAGWHDICCVNKERENSTQPDQRRILNALSSPVPELLAKVQPQLLVGPFCTAIVTQQLHTPIWGSVVADLNLENAKNAFLKAGIQG
jgi:hypothetical protein